MNKKFLLNQLKVLITLFPYKNILIIGSGKGECLDVLDALDIENAILVEADEDQIERMYKLHEFPSTFLVENTLIYKDEENIAFNIATNPEVSCFKDIEFYRELMPNIALIETKKMKSTSLNSFLQKSKEKQINWLFIDTLSSLEILKESEKSFNDLEIIVCKVMAETLDELQNLMQTNNFKLLEKNEENNPDILVAIFVKDYKKKSIDDQYENIEVNKKITELQKVLEAYKDELKTKDTLVDSLSQKFERDLQKLEEEKVALKTEKESAIKQLSSLKIELTKEQGSTKQLNYEKDTLIKNIAKLRGDLDTVIEKENVLKKELELQKSQVKEKTILISSLNKELEKEKIVFEQEKENLKSEIITQKRSIEQLNSESEKLQQSILKLQNELSTYESSIIITNEEYVETKYILEQTPEGISSHQIKLVALAENALQHKKYQEAIYYWQKLAGELENKMPQLYYKRLAFAYTHIGGYPLASEEEEVLYGSYDKHETLKQIHTILQPKFYMEIGVQTGKSLQLAKCKALGIDPMPMLKEKLKLNMELQEQTSDTFFATYAKEILNEPLDLVFIDGMHLFEYALRDFINVESYSTKSTIVVVDDIYPGHFAQAQRDRKTKAWTGDVWKLLAILKEYRKDLKITTLDVFPTGLMVIQNLNNKNNILQDSYNEIIQKYMTYEIDEKVYIHRKGSVDPKKFLDELREV